MFSLAGSPEDIRKFGEQLSYLHTLTPPIYVVGSVGRIAIQAGYETPPTALAVREPQDDIDSDRLSGWRDIDVVAPFVSNIDRSPQYSVLSLGDIPVDPALDHFFTALDGQPRWTHVTTFPLSQDTIRPFNRSLNGYSVRTFSASVQEWLEARWAQLYIRNSSHRREPSLLQYEQFMARLRADRQTPHTELELPAELVRQV